MKFYSGLLLLLVTEGSLLILAPAPALSDNPSSSPRRQVRVTTGIGAVQGWEQGLVEKNPNLARWHWDPIYYYKQGYGPVTSRPLRGNGSATNSKPTGKQTNEAVRPSLSHDFKPIQAPYSPQITAELQGRLLPPKNPPDTVLGKLMNQPSGEPRIATYGSILPYSKNTNNTELKYGSQNTALKYGSPNTAVYGQLLNADSKNRPKNKNIISRKGKKGIAGKTSRSKYDAEKNR